jgi:YHS domain-containing protein
MLVTTLALAISLGLAEDNPIVCPIMGEPVAKNAPTVEYAGARYAFCCPGCDVGFTKDPAGAIKKNEKAKKTIALFLFDPVTRKAIHSDKAKATVDYNGVRYQFESEHNLATFNKDPKKFTAAPKKESLSCPVTGEVIATYSDASNYMDYKDVRYYICCAGCAPTFAKDPAKFAGKEVQEPKVIAQKQN